MEPQRASEPTVGDVMRHWRAVRGVSQLEVSLRARANPRHLSFIETGRARPSETMIDRLVSALDLPAQARESLRHAAGYASEWLPAGDTGGGTSRDDLLAQSLFRTALAIEEEGSFANLAPAAAPLLGSLGFDTIIFAESMDGGVALAKSFGFVDGRPVAAALTSRLLAKLGATPDTPAQGWYGLSQAATTSAANGFPLHAYVCRGEGARRVRYLVALLGLPRGGLTSPIRIVVRGIGQALLGAVSALDRCQ